MMQMRTALLVLLPLAGILALKATAATEIYPTQPITIIVPYTAGGPSDALLRIVGERMQTLLRRPVIIDNVGGAAGRIGTVRGARATPDGYTLINGGSDYHVTN